VLCERAVSQKKPVMVRKTMTHRFEITASPRAARVAYTRGAQAFGPRNHTTDIGAKKNGRLAPPAALVFSVLHASSLPRSKRRSA
jgi:hypothetical protein